MLSILFEESVILKAFVAKQITNSAISKQTLANSLF